MKLIALIARLLLGLVFVVFRMNKVIHLAAIPTPTGDAGVYYSLLFRHHVTEVTGFL